MSSDGALLMRNNLKSNQTKLALILVNMLLVASLMLLAYIYSHARKLERDWLEQQPLRSAHLQTVRNGILENHGPLSQQNPAEYFPLADQVDICECLLVHDLPRLRVAIETAKTRGLTLNERGEFGLTLLFWALSVNFEEGFLELLRNGADPDLKLEESIPGTPLVAGDSVLFASIFLKRANFCLLGLEHSKTGSTSVDHSGVNLIVAYALHGNREDTQFIEALVRAGVNVNDSGRPDFLPLHTVWENMSPGCCIPLLVAEADPFAKDQRGAEFLEKFVRRIADRRVNGEFVSAELVAIETWLSVKYP